MATLEKPLLQPRRTLPEPQLPARPLNPLDSLRLDVDRLEPDKAVTALIEHAVKLHISDLFLNSEDDQVAVTARHLGLLRGLASMTPDIGRRSISYIKTMANMNISERRRPLDGRWLFRRQSGAALDLRINTIPTLHGEDCALRILDREQRLLTLEQLGIERPIQTRLNACLSSRSGLLLVTGPTGTGKSTTLYACLEALNNGERKINTIEDPVEYSIRGIRQSQVNPGIGLGFDDLLRNVLRQAPDVIMIGEIRDAETAMTAVRAAGSGHLVLSTLHAPVATAAMDSLLRLGVHPHLLATSLLGVISQRLLRTLCPKCKIPFDTPAPDLFDGVRHWLQPGQGERLFGPQGCADCYHTGYSGRSAVFEMLQVTPAVRQLVDDRGSASAVRTRAVEQGMIEFRHSAFLKVAQGQTSIEEIVRVLPSESLLAPSSPTQPSNA